MIRGVLIAGNDSVLLNAVEAEAAKRTETYVLAPVSNRFEEAEPVQAAHYDIIPDYAGCNEGPLRIH